MLILFWVGTWFQWALALITMITCAVCYVITEKLFRPIWYEGHKNSKKLSEKPLYINESWRIDDKRNGLGNPKTDLGLDYEDVEFPCGPLRLPGNKSLRGWFIPSPDSDNELCVVVCHGGARDRRQHLRHVPSLQNHGAAVLLFDKQEHGLSDGNQRGIGWFTYEGSDVYAACKHMKVERRFKRIVAMGSSFGGVGVLTAAGYFDKAGGEQMIDGVIAENSPHSRWRFVRELMHKYGAELLLPRLFCEILGIVSCIAIMIRRGDLFTPNPIDIVKNISPRPLLITHGEADTVVPLKHGMDLFEAAQEPKECLWVPNCEHTMVYNVDPIGWRQKTAKIIQQVLKSEGGKPRPSRKCVI